MLKKTSNLSLLSWDTSLFFPDFGRGELSDGVHPERHEALVHPSSSTKTQPPYILKMA